MRAPCSTEKSFPVSTFQPSVSPPTGSHWILNEKHVSRSTCACPYTDRESFPFHFISPPAEYTAPMLPAGDARVERVCLGPHPGSGRVSLGLTKTTCLLVNDLRAKLDYHRRDKGVTKLMHQGREGLAEATPHQRSPEKPTGGF